jgi:hypothetical protein
MFSLAGNVMFVPNLIEKFSNFYQTFPAEIASKASRIQKFQIKFLEMRKLQSKNFLHLSVV